MNGPYQIIEGSDKLLTNSQRIKDRDMQRATERGLDIPALPSKSRLKRMGISETAFIERERKKLGLGDKPNDDSLPV